MFTIKKNWKAIQKDIVKVLGQREWEPTAYICRDGFIPEVSFTTGKIGSWQGLQGFSYMSDECTQGLMKRIASLIPKKFLKKA